MVSRRDYEDLASVPGAVPKPSGKRKPEDGREQHNSTLRSYTTLKPVNQERRAALKDLQFGVQAQACRDIGVCCHCGKVGVTIPHHDLSTGAGGRDEDTLPLQDSCHRRLHQIGDVRFWREAGIEPLVAVEAMRDWVAAGCPQGSTPFGGERK
jgi:hypothetical protein